MNLEVYSPHHIEAFLLNYETLVKELAEVAADWPSLDREERSHHEAVLLQTWGNRKVLGLLYQAHRLSQTQEDYLAELDRLLLEQAPLMAQCYGFDLSRLLAIFRWGTPLSSSTQTLHLEVDPALLDRMATALAPST